MKNFFQQKISKKIILSTFAFAILFQGLFFYWLDFVDADDTTPPIAEELKYFDSDWNNKIDQIQIKFNETITWSLVSSNFWIGSNTWWLATFNLKYSWSWRELSKTGVILFWNVLQIKFPEFDKTWTWLTITSWADSDLRVRTYTTDNWIWITDLNWNPISIWVSDLVDKTFYWFFEQTVWWSTCTTWTCTELKIPQALVWFRDSNNWIAYDINIPVIASWFSWADLSAWSFALKYNPDIINCTWTTVLLEWFASITNTWSVNNWSWFTSIVFENWSWFTLNTWTWWTKILDFNCHIVWWNIWSWTYLSLKWIENGDLNDNIVFSDSGWKAINFWLADWSLTIMKNLTISWTIKNVLWNNISWTWIKLTSNDWQQSSEINYLWTWFELPFLAAWKNYNLSLTAEDISWWISVWDIIKILRNTVWLESFSWYQQLSADVNNDGHVNVLDAVKMRRYLAWLDNTWSVWGIKSFEDKNNLSCYNVNYQNAISAVSSLTTSISKNFVMVKFWDVDWQ